MAGRKTQSPRDREDHSPRRAMAGGKTESPRDGEGEHSPRRQLEMGQGEHSPRRQLEIGQGEEGPTERQNSEKVLMDREAEDRQVEEAVRNKEGDAVDVLGVARDADTELDEALPEASAGEALQVPLRGYSGSELNTMKNDVKARRRDNQMPKETLKQTAANVIMHLAVDDENKTAVREVGGLKRLVVLLGAEDVDVQLNVLGALTKLALNDENKAQMRILMAFPRLIELMDSPDSNVKLQVVELMWNLAGNDENRLALLYSGGVTKLIELLDVPKDADDKRLNLIANGLGALANLAYHPENHVAVRDMGGIKKVIELLDSEHPRIKERAANCLENLALDRENREIIRRHGSVAKVTKQTNRQPQMNRDHAEQQFSPPTISRTFSSSVVEQRQILTSQSRCGGCIATLLKLLSSDNPIFVCASVGVLKNMSVDDDSKEDIVSNDGLRELVKLLSHAEKALGDARYTVLDDGKMMHWVIVGKAAQCIGNFALEEAFRPEIRESEGVRLLLNLLADGTPDVARLAAVGAILNMAVEDDSKVVIRKQGGINKLIPLLSPNLPINLRAVTAMTLTNLGVQEESIVPIAAGGGVEALILCLAAPTDEVLQEKAASALWNLSATDSIKAQICKSNGISLMLNIFETSGFVPAIENCLGTLVSLAEIQVNRFALAQAGAVGLLLPMIQHSAHPSIVEKAVGVIWNMSHDEAVQHAVRQLGGLKPLIGLLSRDSKRAGSLGNACMIRFNAVGAFPLLTELPENIVEMVELGAVPALVELLISESNVMILQNAAQTLGNIADSNVEHQSIIREAKGIEELVHVLEMHTPGGQHRKPPEDPTKRLSWNNRQELLGKCCFAVWLLVQKNEVNQTTFREVGGIDALVHLMNPVFEVPLLEMAAGAICALSDNCIENRDAFRELDGLQKLVALLDHGADAVKLNAAKALCHLSENTENRQVIRKLGAIEKLAQLLSA